MIAVMIFACGLLIGGGTVLFVGDYLVKPPSNTCKNCVSFEVCRFWGRGKDDGQCRFFKKKQSAGSSSDIAIQIGDIVYVINSNYHVINTYTVEKIIIGKTIEIEARNGGHILTFPIDDFGKKFFTTVDDIKRVIEELQQEQETDE